MLFCGIIIKNPLSRVKIKKQMSFTKKVLGLFFVGMLLVGGVAKAQTKADLQAQIAALMAQIKALQSQMATIPDSSGAWCHTFNKNLRIGDNSAEVAYLRMALLKDGFLEDEASNVRAGNPSTENNFSESTSAAVTGFQQKYASEILTPVGLKYGTGFVGVGTRAKLNKLYGCGNLMAPIACTMDVRQCPDGTYVSRVAPKCEFASCPVYKSLTVVSPNGGEAFLKGSKQTISWKDGGDAILCPAGSDCTKPILRAYDIKLGSYDSNCTGNICQMSLIRQPYIIAKNVSGNFYNWETGRILDSNQYVSDGAYVIQVCFAGSDSCDSSDSYFKITSASSIGSPIISGVSGPTTLAVGQQGTWTVKASDPSSGSLFYSVVWGDEAEKYCAPGESCTTSEQVQAQQTATFTHTYSNAGYYSPKFTVTNINGGSAATTISVNVGAVSVPIFQDTITVTYPQDRTELARGATANLSWIQSTFEKSVDLKLVPASGITSAASYNIASRIFPKSNKEQTYSWIIGSANPEASRETLIPDGEYHFRACYSGTDVCGTSKHTLRISTYKLMLNNSSVTPLDRQQMGSALETMKGTLLNMLKNF